MWLPQVYFGAIGKDADPEHGALTVDAVRDVFRFAHSLRSMDVEGVGNWTSVCKTLFPGICTESGVLRFWGMNPESFEQSVQGSQANVLNDVSSPYYMDGRQVC